MDEVVAVETKIERDRRALVAMLEERRALIPR